MGPYMQRAVWSLYLSSLVYLDLQREQKAKHLCYWVESVLIGLQIVCSFFGLDLWFYRGLSKEPQSL